MAKIIISCLFSIILCGCEKPALITKSSRHTGDLGGFILRSIVTHGGQPRNTNNLPILMRDWHLNVSADNPAAPDTPRDYSKGWQTFEIRTVGFSPITGFLAAAFGPPSMLETNTNGTAGYYRERDTGVCLLFFQEPGLTNEIVVRWWGKAK